VTLSKMSQLEGERTGQEFLVGAKLGERRFCQQRKRDHPTRLWNLGSSVGVTHDRSGLLQAFLPAGLARIAQEQAIGMEARGNQHSAGRLKKVGPARSNSDQGIGARRQPGSNGTSDRANSQRQAIGPRRQGLANFLRLAGQNYRNGAGESLGYAACLHTGRGHRKSYGVLHLRDYDLPQFRVWLDQQKVIGWLKRQPLAQAGAYRSQSCARLPCRAKQGRNELVESERIRERHLRPGPPDVDTTSAPKLYPSLAFQLTVCRAHVLA
jgi:hypothetical protein